METTNGVTISWQKETQRLALLWKTSLVSQPPWIRLFQVALKESIPTGRRLGRPKRSVEAQSPKPQIVVKP